MSDPLATVEQLETLLRRTFSDAERDAAELILAGVSAAIRRVTGQTISVVDDDGITIDRDGSRRTLWLPERPVVSVTSITVDGGLVSPADYRVDTEIGEVTFARPLRTWGTPTAFEPRAEVVYSHGFDPVPDDVVQVALEMAMGGIEVPAAGLETEESIGNYSVKFDVDKATVLNEGQRVRLRSYRAPVVA